MTFDVSFDTAQPLLYGEPVVQVSLWHAGSSLNLLAVVDTGAQLCHFPRSLLEQIGHSTLGAPTVEVATAAGVARLPVVFTRQWAFGHWWHDVPTVAGPPGPALIGRDLLAHATRVLGYSRDLDAVLWRTR